MSAQAVLNTVYSLIAQNADATDEVLHASGKSEEATYRRDLDRALGILEDVLAEEDTKTNVVELRAWVEHVNQTMV